MQQRFLTARPFFQEFGTSYAGKDGYDVTADVLRSVALRLEGRELGFEACLTSRPFLTRTSRDAASGCLDFGRPGARDTLHEALELTSTWGWRCEELASMPATTDGGAVLLAGPVAIDPRLCPAEVKLLGGTAERYLLVQDIVDAGGVLCFDPLMAGFVSLSRPQIEVASAAPGFELLRIRLEGRGPSRRARARSVLARGLESRAQAKGPTTGDAWRELLARLGRWSGAAALRLQLCLQEFARLRFHWACLLGWTELVTPRIFAMADVLHAQISDACTLMALARERQQDEARRGIEAMAHLEDVLSELCEACLS